MTNTGDYRINGIGVGRPLDSFVRSTKYREAFDKIGDSKDNVRIIKNFLSKDECSQIILDATQGTAHGDGQWTEMIYPLELPEQLAMVKEIWEREFDIKVSLKNGLYLVRWTKGKSMPLHVDDLGSGDEQISAVIYLNDDYEGGQISFPTHDIEISPETGDLIIFPGNLNYAHEVKPVISGNRYTVPIWAQIK
jgi:hypothetical protein